MLYFVRVVLLRVSLHSARTGTKTQTYAKLSTQKIIERVRTGSEGRGQTQIQQMPGSEG